MPNPPSDPEVVIKPLEPFVPEPPPPPDQKPSNEKHHMKRYAVGYCSCVDCRTMFTIYTEQIRTYIRCSACATRIMVREHGTRVIKD